MKKVLFDMRSAYVEHKITESPQKQMESLGYKIISSQAFPMFDQINYVVEEFIENPPKYITQIEGGNIVRVKGVVKTDNGFACDEITAFAIAGEQNVERS